MTTASAWPTGDTLANGSAVGSSQFAGGGYQLTIVPSGGEVVDAPTQNYTLGDMSVEVDVRQMSGPPKEAFGVVCRAAHGACYSLTIAGDGSYAINKSLSFSSPEVVLQQSTSPSDAIHPGHGKNHIRGDCVGTTVTLYINGTQLMQVHDRGVTYGSGGVLAHSKSAAAGAQVIFTNFALRGTAGGPISG